MWTPTEVSSVWGWSVLTWKTPRTSRHHQCKRRNHIHPSAVLRISTPHLHQSFCHKSEKHFRGYDVILRLSSLCFTDGSRNAVVTNWASSCSQEFGLLNSAYQIQTSIKFNVQIQFSLRFMLQSQNHFVMLEPENTEMKSQRITRVITVHPEGNMNVWTYNQQMFRHFSRCEPHDGLRKSQGITKLNRIQPLGTLIICTKLTDIPWSSCWDSLVWI